MTNHTKGAYMYLSMFLFLFSFGFLVLFNLRFRPNKSVFLNRQNTQALRGFASLIVVLVHIPAAYQNPIQDAIGSFAYIGVTFFFFISAFGIQCNLIRQSNYLKDFWKRRLPSLLIPMLLTNLFTIMFRFLHHEEVSFSSLFSLNSWVLILLLFYVVFWFVNWFFDKMHTTHRLYADITICVLVLAYSLLGHLFDIPKSWACESIGLLYGIILANYLDSFYKTKTNHWQLKTLILAFSSIVIGLLYLRFKAIFFWGSYCLKVILGLLVLLLLFHIETRFDFHNPISLYLGKISYSTYLLHDLSFSIVESLFPSVGSGFFIWISLLITFLIASLNTVLSGKTEQSVRTLLSRKRKLQSEN